MTPPDSAFSGTASFGYWIRRRRQALDMTQAVLARRVGCATVTIQKLEYEERRPSAQMAARLADCLAIPDDERATFIASMLGEVTVSNLPLDSRPVMRPPDGLNDAVQDTPTAAGIPTNLPQQLTPFVGREPELAALHALLERQEVRLVTITGPGGMGKTRLALALAERCVADPRFADGVYFIPLAPLGDAQHIVSALASILSLSLRFGDRTRTPAQQLLDFLRDKSMLLLFDNFEHLLNGAAFVAQILEVAPHVQVLVTSREWLRLPGEHLFRVEGLAYGGGHYGDAAAGLEAVQLFIQSAKLTLPHLVMNEADLAEVVKICGLVGGMPLGIELAASWVAVLSLADITAEIRRSLDFLETTRRGSREEHQSMRAVFESSWRQLDPAHQSVLARLAIFRGGFMREAAEAVAGASSHMLKTLVGKSLIEFGRDRGRYTLHELLRQFAEEKLQGTLESAHATYGAFCTYYTTFLQARESHLVGPKQLEAIVAIEADIDNIRMAWQWAVTHREIQAISRGLDALSHFYATKSWYEEGFQAFTSAAQALHMEEPAGREGVVLGRVLAAQGLMLTLVDQAITGATVRDEARRLCQRSLHILESLGAREERAVPLYCLGTLAHTSGEIQRAVQLFHDALSLCIEHGDRLKTALMYGRIGSCHASMGDYEPAIAYHRQAVRSCSATGDLRSLGAMLYELADALRAAGAYAEAKAVAEETLALSGITGARRNASHALRILGELALNLGDFETAQQHASASLALMQELGLSRMQDAPLVVLGRAACGLGDYALAREYFYRVLHSHQQAGTLNASHSVADAAVGLADVLAKEAQREQAVEVLRLALQHPAIWYETKQQAMQLFTRLTLPLEAHAAQLP